MTRRMRIACIVGASVGVLFLLGFIVTCLQVKDPQIAIALFFSPLYASWVGVAAGCVAFGSMGIAARHSETHEEAAQALVALLVGLAAMGVMAAFLIGEAVQLNGSR